jgi:hypothetical protein
MDRLHPTAEATEYICEKFADCFCDETTRRFIKDWTGIRRDLDHRPFHPSSSDHQKFLRELLRKLEHAQSHADVSKEIDEVNSKLRT